MDWRYLKKGLLTASGKSPDLSRRYVVARDLQCGGTWQSPPPEDAEECVPGPQPGLFRGSHCSGHAPRIASRRPRANHSGVTPGTQGIHMTQNLYYSVEKNRVVASDSQAVPTAPIVYSSSSLRGQAIDSSWHTSNQNGIMPFSMPCYSYFSKLDTSKFRAKFG